MRFIWGLSLRLLLALFPGVFGLHIPLEVEQLPTITAPSSPSSLIAFPFDESFTLKCEAKGNPVPVYRWTRDGQDFDPHQDPKLIKEGNTGNFVIPNNNDVVKYQGKYRCYASNKLGTAISEETEFIVPTVPKFPKENIDPIEVEEGEPMVLECNPPKGIPPLQIYWMTIGLQHIDQDERVSMGLDGNLYFSNTLEKDSRGDYCCFAYFQRIRTIVQKTAMTVRVKSTYSVQERKPSLLLPSGVQSEIHLVRGEELELECITQGFPTPTIEWTKMGEKLPKHTNIKNYGKLLTISKVKEENDGKYMCKANNSVGETVHYFNVTVEEPPRWAEEPPKSQLAMIGSDVHINCSTTGKPQPRITWKRNGQPLDDMPTSSRKVFHDTIVLHNVQQNDSAVYQCEASNNHGTILGNANILVLNRPPLILTKDYQEYAAVQGGYVVMDCNVFSSPPATISWTKGDTEDSVEGERFSVFKNGSLQIHRVEKEDTEQYTCFATNSEGRSTITANLDIKDPTRIVDPPQDLQILRGTMAQLICHAEYDKSLRRQFEILWEKDGEQLFSNLTEHSGYFIDDGILKILNVSHSNKGLYTCIARTNLDENTASAQVTVLDVPDAPEELMLFEYKDRSVKLKWMPSDDHENPITEFIIEFEEDQWEPGRWRELRRVPGSQESAHLPLQGHINYQLRVSALNAIGQGPASKPTERYKTPPAAPDRNPENIRIDGHLPHQMDINWEPLFPVEHNGPGLEYKVSYRRLGVEDSWKEQMVKRHSLVVKNTPTFVPYEIKIQSHNLQGWGPEPRVVTGYSGEDLPVSAPQDVVVEVINSTLLRVSWAPVPRATVRGHLGGYSVHWWRTQSLLTSKKIPEEKQSLTLPGNRSHTMVSGLKPFSEYSLIMNVFNKRGNGPRSHPVTFRTPEGVPAKAPILRATNPQRDSITLVWAPPYEANGILTGYMLQYQMINDTMAVGDMHKVNISSPDTTQWVLRNLEMDTMYRFYLGACTEVGCGSFISEKGSTVSPSHFSSTTDVTSIEIRQPFTFTSPRTIISPVANFTLSTIVLFNVTSFVSDTFVQISWTTSGEQQDSELYIAYMNHRDGNWKISEAVNISKTFHIIERLKPGTVYTVRLMANRWVDNSSIFEDVFQTRGKGVASVYGGISTKGWFVGMMCAVALLTLVVLIACFVTRNKGGKYAVKEKEEVHPESQGMNDENFCEYSDNDEKPLKGSPHSLDDDIKVDNCEDSLVDYGDEDSQFSEDGSFIGEYSGQKHRVTMEVNGAPSGTA